MNDTATPEIYTYCHPLSLHDALPIADRGDVAFELARRLAVDHVELGAGARVRGHAAPGADRAVAMRHPRLAFGRVARGGEAVHEADLRRPSVLVRQRVEVAAGGGAFELGRQLRLRAAQRLAQLAFLGDRKSVV